MAVLMSQDQSGPEDGSDDPIGMLRRDLDDVIRLLDATREWLHKVEETQDALEHRVAVHHSAFTIGALEPPAER